MKQRLTIALLLVLLASGGHAHANFRDGLLAYEKKDYAKAFSEFESLAKLGHAQSQYMLGALYSRGEGASANLFLAYGWMRLAAEGGHENARRALPGLRAHMAEESVGAAERLLGEYSPAALDKRLMPKVLPNCEYDGMTQPVSVKRVAPRYPEAARRGGIEGSVYVEMTVAEDGSVRDTRVVHALPAGVFEGEVLAATSGWKFLPATKAGVPAVAVGTVAFSFKLTGNSSEARRALKKWLADARKMADDGVPQAQYIYGIVIAGHPSIAKPWSEAMPWITKSAQGGYAPAQFQLGHSLMNGRGCEADETKALEWLRLAAQQGEPNAQVSLARLALRAGPGYEPDKAIFWLKRASLQDHGRANKYLAAIYAASPIENLRSPRKAIELIDKIEKGDSKEPTTMEIRAAALAATGMYQAAVEIQNLAIKRAKSLEWDTASMEDRLSSYSAGQAWVGDLLIF